MCKVGKNKRKVWLSTILVGVCSIALLACGSEESAQGTVGNVQQSEEKTLVTEIEITESTQVAETESTAPQETVVNDNSGSLDVEGRMLQVNGKLYYATSETGPMGDADCVAGHIETSVAEGEMPQQDNESNFECVGSPYTYDDGRGSIQVLMEDENYYWFYSDDKITWQEYTKFVVTNGNNGEQQERTASDSSYAEVQQALTDLSLWDIPEDNRVGYPYCLRTYDDAGNVLQTITIYEDTINIDGDLYKEARVRCIKALYDAVDALYEK